MYGCGEQEVGVASGSGWNLWVWLLGVVVRRYIDFLILLIPLLLLYLYFFAAASLLFWFIFKNVFRSLYIYRNEFVSLLPPQVNFWSIHCTRPHHMLLNGKKLPMEKLAPSVLSITTFN